MDGMSMDDLGGVVRGRRKELGLTQPDLADLAGVSVRFLRDLESGKDTVRLDKLVAVLEILGLRLTVAPRSTG